MKQTIITLTLLGCAVSFSAESQNLAVKTNLLSDAFAVPEAAVEFAFEGVAELPLLKLLRIEYFEPKYDFSILI